MKFIRTKKELRNFNSFYYEPVLLQCFNPILNENKQGIKNINTSNKRNMKASDKKVIQELCKTLVSNIKLQIQEVNSAISLGKKILSEIAYLQDNNYNIGLDVIKQNCEVNIKRWKDEILLKCETNLYKAQDQIMDINPITIE